MTASPPSSSSSSVSLISWAAWIVTSLFFAYQYILRVMPNVMTDEIIGRFDIGAIAFGQFSGIYYIGYSLMHVPIGMMLDRFGPRSVMTICILLSAIGMLPLALADYWIYPTAGRLLLGMSSSAAILGIFKIVRMIFSNKHFGRMVGFSAAIGFMGAIYGGAPLHYMYELMGYQPLILFFVGIGFFLAIVTYFLVPVGEKVIQGSMLADVKEVAGNSKVLLSCFFGGLMVGPLSGFADIWGTPFLKQVYGLDRAVAASLPSMIFVGMCFGSPVLSLIAERAGGYLTTIIGSGIVMTMCFFLLVTSTLDTTIISVNFIVVGICSAYQILAISQATTYTNERVAGLTTALANMIIMIFGYGFHTAIGAIVNFAGGPSESAALIDGITIIPITLAIGSIGFTFLFLSGRRADKETGSTVSV